ncbi:hypothetical protein JCM10450v2_005067 [Rhodotorula kratochvilovae]
MDGETLIKLAEARAASDTKVLKKTIAAFYALLDPSASGDKLHANHASLDVALDQLAQLLDRANRIAQVTGWEIDSYRAEVGSLETSAKLGELGDKLRSAQQERARRIEYDGLARVIARLPDRQKGHEQHARLESDIALLLAESQTYAETWQARKLAFDAIVSSLEVMQEAIRDEKAEQERRRALDEDDADAEDSPAAGGGAAALDPTAKEFVPGAPAPEGAGGADEDVAMADADGDGEGEGREEGQMTDEQETQEQLQGQREEGEMA